ncbi:sec1 family domain-containing protein 2 isoform X2 [Rhinatrema bivittatum]|uniref:sec1 family domain-containing protein 2 isoform X2 n=1 Tax=Rhinatrema bivittatum TaxID=194408 RepID=UPI00112AF0CB|nr:sec1 family domain-containing protein 2 isoform X2 [Rhinatrema bivittatum]
MNRSGGGGCRSDVIFLRLSKSMRQQRKRDGVCCGLVQSSYCTGYRYTCRCSLYFFCGMAAAAAGPACFCQNAWERVLNKSKRALVFLDPECAESLHWIGGARRLLDAGALNVKEFSSFESGSANQPKAVFVVSSLLKGRTVEIIRDIVSLSAFQYCAVFTALPHSLHLWVSNASSELEGSPVFQQFEEKLCEWMGNMNYTAEVMYTPVLFAPLSPHLYLAPAFASLFPLGPRELSKINSSRSEKKKFASLSDVDFPSLPAKLQILIKSLVSGLNQLFEYLDVREECFAVGAFSRLVAGDLAHCLHAKNRRKTAQNKAALVFIDRTLDLTGAVGHHGDNLVEKIISVLPRLPGHTNDVMVSTVDLTVLHAADENPDIVAPGCLAQPNDPAAKALWESLLSIKHKEAVMEVRRHLVEAASRENLPIKMSMGRVTPEQLNSYIQLFKKNTKALENHCGLLQLGLATAQTLKHPQFAKWDNFLAFERLLLQNIGDLHLPGVLNQLHPMIKSHSERKDDDYSLDELLMLLVYIYSVVEEIPLQKDLDVAEDQIKKAFVQVFCSEPELSSLLQKITGCESSPELTFQKTKFAVDEIFKSLREITKARTHMKQFNSVYISGSSTRQASYKPLLKQVVEEIFHPDRSDCADIEHMSAGLTDLLKTGFSMFMKVSRPHPSDHPLLILFVIGGVTVSEVKMVNDLLATHKPGVQVIVLSSKLLKPLDIPELLFATDHLHPDIGI